MRFSILLAALALAACGDAEVPPTDPAPAPPVAADDGRQSVADVVAQNPRLRVTARLMASSGLDETLRDTSTAYTLFAPSDDAWDALGQDAVQALDADPAAARDALLGHVIGTRMLSFGIFGDLAFDSQAGTELAFSETADGLRVRGPGGAAAITDADLDADNGVVHIVDGVLSR